MFGRRRSYTGPLSMGPRGGRAGGKMRLVMALGMALFSLYSYYSFKEYNPVTGQQQYISITPRQEIALGLQAAPQMAQQYGGVYPDKPQRERVKAVGQKLVRDSAAANTQWQYDFHLLGDTQTVNAFALPGGQVFITAALYGRLKTEGQLAGVLGHEIGHVIARHGAQRMAKSKLTEGLTGAVVIASGDYSSGRLAQMVGQMVNMKYGREDELESDRLGVQFMAEAGYDPRAMIEVMKILAAASGGGGRQPEFFSTHPNPGNRIQEIEAAIQRQFPSGVPAGLVP